VLLNCAILNTNNLESEPGILDTTKHTANIIIAHTDISNEEYTLWLIVYTHSKKVFLDATHW
jgi:hypothetical protein